MVVVKWGVSSSFGVPQYKRDFDKLEKTNGETPDCEVSEWALFSSENKWLSDQLNIVFHY